MPRIDELLASVIKGAAEAGASVEQLTIGREEKLAGLGGALGSAVGPLGSAAGAGLQDKTWGSAAGAGAGALLGGAAGTALGGMAGRSIGELIDADPHLSQTVGSILGMIGGGAAGGHFGQNALRPEKQANQGGMGALLGASSGSLLDLGRLGGQGGAAVGAGLGADPGRGLEGALGGGAGHALGTMAGGGLAHLLHADPAVLQKVLGMAGGAIGGHIGGRAPKEPGLFERVRSRASDGVDAIRGKASDGVDAIRGKFSSAEDAYLAGSAAAAAQYKVAIAPLIAGGLSMLAGPLARAGLGRVAGGALGKMGGGAVGRAASGMANFAKKPMGGMMFDTGASMAAQSAMS